MNYFEILSLDQKYNYYTYIRRFDKELIEGLHIIRKNENGRKDNKCTNYYYYFNIFAKLDRGRLFCQKIIVLDIHTLTKNLNIEIFRYTDYRHT